MSEAMRGFVLLLSVLLWLPVLRPFLDGQMRADEAILRYAGALALAWGGVSLIAMIIRAYTPEPEPEPEEEPAATTAKAAPPSPAATAARAAGPTSAGADTGPSDSDDLMPDGSPRRRTEDLSR